MPVGSDEDEADIVAENQIPCEYLEARGELEFAGCYFEVELSTVLGDSEYYNSFIYKIQYNQAQEYFVQLKAKQKTSDALLLDLL